MGKLIVKFSFKGCCKKEKKNNIGSNVVNFSNVFTEAGPN